MDDPIAQVFATNPKDLTDAQLERIIAHYREARKNFDLGEKAPPKKKEPKKDKIDIDLDVEIG